jgi:hypothetical protein
MLFGRKQKAVSERQPKASEPMASVIVELLKQNRDLHDRLMAMSMENFDYVKMQRDTEAKIVEAQAKVETQVIQSRMPMRMEPAPTPEPEGREVTLPGSPL